MIPLYKPHVPGSAAAILDQVLQSGQIAGDGNLPEFEGKLAEFLGAPYVAATAEFSRSIEMAIRMAGLGPGDSILLSPQACLATTMPILQTGARPVWCDIEPDSGNLQPGEILRKHSAEVKAVLLYHWVGVPADIDAIKAAATEYGLKIIEDAGEALGAEYGGKRIGAHGLDYSVFSFSPVRHVTTGEGAAIVFRDVQQYEFSRLWRRYGIPSAEFRDQLGEIRAECDIRIPGFHNFMNRLAGALGVAQMACLPALMEAQRKNGRFFDDALPRIAGLQPLRRPPGSIPSYWVYCFLCDHRDDLLRRLREAGIYASKVHLRNDSYSCFGTGACDLPGVAEFARKQLCIPCGWWLSEEDRDYIVETIRAGW